MAYVPPGLTRVKSSKSQINLTNGPIDYAHQHWLMVSNRKEYLATETHSNPSMMVYMG